jgi:hypothetical protein
LIQSTHRIRVGDHQVLELEYETVAFGKTMQFALGGSGSREFRRQKITDTSAFILFLFPLHLASPLKRLTHAPQVGEINKTEIVGQA